MENQEQQIKDLQFKVKQLEQTIANLNSYIKSLTYELQTLRKGNTKG